jgi:hypothetical protein
MKSSQNCHGRAPSAMRRLGNPARHFRAIASNSLLHSRGTLKGSGTDKGVRYRPDSFPFEARYGEHPHPVFRIPIGCKDSVLLRAPLALGLTVLPEACGCHRSLGDSPNGSAPTGQGSGLSPGRARPLQTFYDEHDLSICCAPRSHFRRPIIRNIRARRPDHPRLVSQLSGQRLRGGAADRSWLGAERRGLGWFAQQQLGVPPRRGATWAERSRC